MRKRILLIPLLTLTAVSLCACKSQKLPLTTTEEATEATSEEASEEESDEFKEISDTTLYAVNVVSVYAEPSAKSELLSYYPYGSEITVVQENSEWYGVMLDDTLAFIPKNDHLSTEAPQKPHTDSEIQTTTPKAPALNPEDSDVEFELSEEQASTEVVLPRDVTYEFFDPANQE